jgi:hypothetical protein
MRPTLIAAVVLAAATAASAQDDYELGNALAERGWYDLAEEMFGRIGNSTTLTPDQKAEGEYGLARLNIQMAERAESTEEKSKIFQKAIDAIEGFRKKFPAHRLAGEALSDIAYVYQSKGKALVTAAKSDPAKMDEAEKAFSAAEKLFQDLIGTLKKNEVKLPEDPQKDPKGLATFAAWEEKMMFAKYNYALALFSHAETFKDNQTKHPDMKRLLEAMNKFLNDDFMWQYETYLLAYDAFIYMGRAYQLLAETSDREKADQNWQQCFVYLGKPRGLLSDKEARKSESVREIASRALLFEMKARASYGDAKRGQQALQQYATAVRSADDFFKAFPNMRFEETGKALRLEQGRLMCKAGQVQAGVKLLQELAKAGKDTWVENAAIDILGEYGADQSPSLAVEAANNFYERGPAYMYRAMQKYRKALQVIRKAEDQKYVPECWYQLGWCYYYLGRPHEAMAALSIFEKPPLQGAKEAGKACMLKLQCLQKISKTTKDKADEKALEDYRQFVTRTFPNEASEQLLSQTAIALEGDQKFLDAAREWEKLAVPGKTIFEEALFMMAFDYYREGKRVSGDAAKQKVQAEKEKLQKQVVDQWTKSLEGFRKHLGAVDKLTTKDANVVKRAIGSIYHSCLILTQDRVGKPQEALDVSADLDKRFPTADARFSIAIMAYRIDAKIKLGQVQEAEEDLRSLKAKFEKEQIGLDHYTRALTVLANAFLEAAGKEKDKDAEKYEMYSMRAAAYYLDYYRMDPTSIKKDIGKVEAMAQMIFVAAEQRSKTAQAKSDKELATQAKADYASAYELYNEFLLQREVALMRTPDGQGQIRSIKARMTKCLLAAGDFDKAIQTYEAITKDDPQMRDGSSWEELADCYVEKARNLPTGNDKKTLLTRAEETYARLAILLMQNQRFDEHTYRLLYKRSAVLLETNPDMLASFFRNMELRGHHPKWDADDKTGVSRYGFQPKFAEIKAKLDTIVVPKK